MNDSLLQIYRFLFRKRVTLIIVPIIATLIAAYMTRNITRTYETSMTLYTGIVSETNLDSSVGRQDIGQVNNAMDNITNILTSKTTLKNVSMRLYAQHMMFGDINHDNNYIQAANLRAIYNRTPIEVRKLIDKNSEENTLRNLEQYEQANNKNFVYGLFNWTPKYYSYQDLSKISVKRLNNSDIIQISYSADDPGVAYQTLVLLEEEFKKQYEILRYGETNNVITYFEYVVDSLGKRLNIREDELTDYSIEKKVINYDEQTKSIASLSRDFALVYNEIARKLASSEQLLTVLDERVSDNVKSLRNNSLFMNKMSEISDLSAKVATLEPFSSDSTAVQSKTLLTYREQLKKAEADLNSLADEIVARGVTKEGVSSDNVVNEWLQQLIDNEKAKSEMMVLNQRLLDLDDDYRFYAPVGTTIARQEREIGFLEQSYLTMLNSLNAARLRQKNLQMTSAVLKPLSPATFPVSAIPSKRKLIVLVAFAATFIFLVVLLALIEMLDHTLHDRSRAAKFTGHKIDGIYPLVGKLPFKAFKKQWSEIASKQMSNRLLNYINNGKTGIINIISSESGDGKSYLADNIAEYWTSQFGLKVKKLTADIDFKTEGKEFIMARSIKELCDTRGMDIIIVEYKALKTDFAPFALLKSADVNLWVLNAYNTWDEEDIMIFNKVKDNIGDTPLCAFLNMTDVLASQEMIGMLPPYTTLRKIGYRFYKLGFTSK